MERTSAHLETPLHEAEARNLRAGDGIALSGVVYTGRDAAHARLLALLERGDALPVDLRDAVIFYVGPTPAPPGRALGSAGPTTSGRMDRYAPRLIAECGLRGMVGKGARNAEVREACARYGAVYFGAIGGLGALLGQCVVAAEVVAWPELGTEAMRRLVVKDLPLLVVNDAWGGDAYEAGRKQYARSGL